MADTIVLGSVNVDLVIRGSRLPIPGETVVGGEFFQAPGGKGANQAVAAARAARGRVTFLAAVGDDEFGRAAREGFVRDRLDDQFITRIPGCSTGIALILVDATGQNLISVASGANACLTPADVDSVPAEVFQSARVFLASLETPLITVRRGLERAREAGLMTILNPAPADRRIVTRDFLELVDVLTPNETELQILCGPVDEAGEGAGSASPEASPWSTQALRLRACGCRMVIATLGAEGCLVVGESVLAVPAFRVRAVDATAAGDAFNGALAARLAEGKAIPEAVQFASAAAALSVTRAGAQPSLPIRREILDLLESPADSH